MPVQLSFEVTNPSLLFLEEHGGEGLVLADELLGKGVLHLATKEVFILPVLDAKLSDHFYLLWALSLKAVRDQRRRIALMQTNREDCGTRYLEVILPKPKNIRGLTAFQSYFTMISDARAAFIDRVQKSKYQHVANVASAVPLAEA